MSIPTLIMRRSGDKLVPVTEWDREHLLEIPEGKDLSVKTSRSRSSKQHRLFWSLMKIVVDNHPYYLRPEQLVEWLKVRLGYVEEVMFHDGGMMTKVSSISFSSMGQDDFQKFLTAKLTQAPKISNVKTSLNIRSTKSLPGIPFEAII